MQHFDSLRFHLLVALSIPPGCLPPQVAWVRPAWPAGSRGGPPSGGDCHAVADDSAGTLITNNIASGQSDMPLELHPERIGRPRGKQGQWMDADRMEACR
ncbi:hypothetical protein [Kaistia adipata]|uniref:hypothetical protein n=1 Tax=Kaistia adipata TaxID=166954 RepID=UPI0012EC7CA4|nr:hypothetical protein [Kaistia adipata]